MKFLFILFLPATVFAATSATKSNQMKGFEYASCGVNACVLIDAPKAYIGLSLDAFSTTGATTLRITDLQGHQTAIYKGSSASLNPQMETLILDSASGGFMMYSLKDGKVTDYTGGAK